MGNKIAKPLDAGDAQASSNPPPSSKDSQEVFKPQIPVAEVDKVTPDEDAEVVERVTSFEHVVATYTKLDIPLGLCIVPGTPFVAVGDDGTSQFQVFELRTTPFRDLKMFELVASCTVKQGLASVCWVARLSGYELFAVTSDRADSITILACRLGRTNDSSAGSSSVPSFGMRAAASASSANTPSPGFVYPVLVLENISAPLSSGQSLPHSKLGGIAAFGSFHTSLLCCCPSKSAVRRVELPSDLASLLASATGDPSNDFSLPRRDYGTVSDSDLFTSFLLWPTAVTMSETRRLVIVADWADKASKTLNSPTHGIVTAASCVRVFSYDSHACLFSIGMGIIERPQGVAIDRRGRMAVSDGKEHAIRVFDVNSGRLLWHIGANLGVPTALDIDHSSGRLFVSEIGGGRLFAFEEPGWSPEGHRLMPAAFRAAVRTVLVCARGISDLPDMYGVWSLPNELIFMIFREMADQYVGSLASKRTS